MKMPAELIREEILRDGAIPFARFMELALYCPETGYYERNRDNVGRAGDFITSVSTGSLFGELLAFQFGAWLENLKQFRTSNSPLHIVEAGAHDGKLAADILSWLKSNRTDLFGEIEYLIVEPSTTRQQWQRERLKQFSNVRWATNLGDHTSLTGICISNELLDAFPVRRLGWDAKNKIWFEHMVESSGEQFVWTRSVGGLKNTELPAAIGALPPSLLEVLPDGYSIEVSPAAETWWSNTAKHFGHGKLVAIDYGFSADEIISPSRSKGTLRAYFKHQVNDDLLANPGEQDLTAHVNFSAIQKCGEDAGLKTEVFCTQPQFLTRILSEAVKQNLFSPLTPNQIRQFQTLTHPNHLGRAFRVLVQSR
jgi:SAM-dependent MidA family methyltransferase